MRRNQITPFGETWRVHLNRRLGWWWWWWWWQSAAGRRAIHITLQGLYCSCKPVICSHVTLAGYPLHSLVSPSFLHPCVSVCHHISNAVKPLRLHWLPSAVKDSKYLYTHTFADDCYVSSASPSMLTQPVFLACIWELPGSNLGRTRLT